MAKSDPSRRIDGLLRLQLPDDALALTNLPAPTDSVLKRLAAPRLREAVEHFQALWLHLADGRPWMPRDGSLGPGTAIPYGGEGGFWAVLHTVGAYFAYSLYRYALKADAESAIELLERPEIVETDGDEDESPEKLLADILRLQAETMFIKCETCALGLFFAARIDRLGFQPGELNESHDADVAAFSALEGFHDRAPKLSGELLSLSNLLLALGLEYRKASIKERGQRKRDEIEKSLALVSPREIVLLSARVEVMKEKYGAKEIERKFEQQVGLLFQALGFTVIAARPGEAIADLLCISREGQYSFLVDAKSSRKSYAFPKDDRRAIKDYINDFGLVQPDLPKLAFVLIVSHSAATTMSAKLKELENEASLPVRFIDSGVLTRLQKTVVGPLPPKLFYDAIRDSPAVINSTIIDVSRAALEGVNSAYASFVRSLRSIGS